MLNCLIKKLNTKMDVTTMKRRIKGSFYLLFSLCVCVCVCVCVCKGTRQASHLRTEKDLH